MPAINPNNYNIDNFDSQNLGPISVTDFRTYVLNHNLQDVEPNIQSAGYGFYPRGVYAGDLWNPNQDVQDLPNLSILSYSPSPLNNNTSPRPDNLSKNIWTNNNPFYGSPTNEEQFEVTTKSLENPGSVDNWIVEGGFSTDVSTVRNVVNLSNNEYGPEFISTYNDLGTPLATGYKQYPSSAGGDVLGPIIARTLGFSDTNFINFPSQLQDVGRERRLEELKNRVMLNFVSDTVGSLNLDPLGILAGESIYTPNYAITRPANFVGKVAEFTANLAGFNIPTSIIPGGKTIKIGSNAFQEDLLEYTGKGQKDLLYANVYSSKYSPELLSKGFDPSNMDSAKTLGKIGEFFDDLGKETTDNYLKLTVKTEEEKKSLANKVGNFINDMISPNAEKSMIPTPEKDNNPNDPFVTMGIEGTYSAIESLDPNSSFNEQELDSPSYLIKGANTEYFPNKTTLRPSLFDADDPNSAFTHQTPSTNKMFDWRDRTQPVAKRGLLQHTQNMINNSEANGHRGGAKYIGRFNSNSNLVQAQKDIGNGQVVSVPKHKDVSMGNLVRSGDDTFYCRSWSTRNPYQNHYDLIRNDSLFRNKFINNLSVLEDNGHVKIGPNTTDDFNSGSLLFNQSNDIKRYMFSIENLAWLDAPHKSALDPCELGPNGGRIMWFPPYDINFTDNTSTNWETNNFIGRAEPIYTYNNTERKGSLSFSIVVDHPSVINSMKQESEEKLYKFFAGCGIDVADLFEEEVIQVIQNQITIVEATKDKEVETIPVEVPIPETKVTKEPPFTELLCYFRNARNSKLSDGKRAGVGRTISLELEVGYELSGNSKTDKGEILNLNQDFVDKVDALIDFLASEDGQSYGVKFIGYTSAAASTNYNEVLSIDRATSVYDYVVNQVKSRSETNGTYNQTNFGNSGYGYFCSDQKNGGKCRTELEKIKNIDGKGRYYYNLTIDDAQIPEIPDTRWVIIAKGEAGSQKTDGDGNTIEDEDVTYGNANEFSKEAKKDRKVKLEVFDNLRYSNKNTIIKMDPKKAETLPTSVSSENLEPIGLTKVSGPLPEDANTGLNLLTNANTNKVDPVLSEQEKTQAQAFSYMFGNKTDKVDPTGNNLVTDNTVKDAVTEQVIKKTVQKLFTECSYFEKIKKEDPFVYETINQKIKHFHPAFHSMTPEGFNSRLTFLQQCMRQGPSISERSDQAQNMAFGRPPICVLRIGDFYYTKVVIDSLNVTYEPLLWDLNPEGIGVQPQIAKIDLNFSFIGGSSIDGPIRQLQNAVSFNFFANTSVYNSRRYYNVGDDKYETLDEKLKADANKKVNVNDKYFGYGSFKSQAQADSEVVGVSQVGTSNDSLDQTVNVAGTGAGGQKLPVDLENLAGTVTGTITTTGSTSGDTITTTSTVTTPSEPQTSGNSDDVFIVSKVTDPSDVNSVISTVFNVNGDWALSNASVIVEYKGPVSGYNPPKASCQSELSNGGKFYRMDIRQWLDIVEAPQSTGTTMTYNKVNSITLSSEGVFASVVSTKNSDCFTSDLTNSLKTGGEYKLTYEITMVPITPEFIKDVNRKQSTQITEVVYKFMNLI